ncbi:hypothetical protein [Conexibacter sp. SYSU D00693]|uniref:hypothetical protein n=1 Tax=Conexibacter sp. SYSU D00693 TaxID=2812560 RepID=UPI00196ABB6D|nr:hypothetical protein [Conexibacter sp. SYSU D00693]
MLRRLERVPWWLPAVPGVAFLLALVVQGRDLVKTLALNADNAAPFVIAELLDEAGPGREVLLGNYAWYEALWSLQLTGGLPGHRAIWGLLPFAVMGLAVAAVAWATWRVAGRWAALCSAVLLGAMSPLLIAQLGELNAHGLVLAHAALAAAAVVLLVERGAGWGPGRLALWAIVVGALTGPGVASDVLVVLAALVPMVVVALLAEREGLPRRVGLALVAAAALALAGGLALHAVAEDSGVRSTGFTIAFAESDELWRNLRLLGTIVAAWGNGDPFGEELDLWSALAAVCAVAMAVLVWRAVRGTRRGGVAALTARPLLWRAYAAFWAVGGTLVAAAFVLTSVPVDEFSARYVLAGWAALCVLVVLAARDDRDRLLTGVLVSLVAAVSVVELVRGESTANTSNFVSGGDTGALARFVREQGLDHGYGPYWSALTTTWQTRTAAKVYPVYHCAGNADLCPYHLHRISSWYVPKPGVRTFIVVDTKGPAPGVAEPSQRIFGKPAAVTGFGQLNVYVYDYDVAERLRGAGSVRP